MSQECNTLEEAESRLGWLYDGNKETPDIAVMLRNTGSEVELIVPLSPRTTAYNRWFSWGFPFPDDPHPSDDYKLPRNLLFADKEGGVALLGCRVVGTTRTLLDHGVGRIVANFAVRGATGVHYDRVNGLRTRIQWLTHWSNLTSQQTSLTQDESGLVKRFSLTLESPPPIKLAPSMNLTLKSDWSVNRGEDDRVTSAHDGVCLETRTSRPRMLWEHLSLHSRIRDLLVIATWEPVGFSSISVSRSDDLYPGVRGIGHERWLPVTTYTVPATRLPQRARRFLFTLPDIHGARGIQRWIQLTKRYERAIQPLIAIREFTGHMATEMFHVGAALEALAHRLAVEKLNRKENYQVNFKEDVKLIVADLPFTPFTDSDDWRARAHACYMGVKHPDRPYPDQLVLAETLRESILVIQLWIAGRLGAKEQTLRKRLQVSQLGTPYQLVE